MESNFGKTMKNQTFVEYISMFFQFRYPKLFAIHHFISFEFFLLHITNSYNVIVRTVFKLEIKLKLWFA